MFVCAQLYKMVRTSQTASYDDSSNSLNSKSKSEMKVAKKSPPRAKFAASCFVSRNYIYYMTNVYSFNFLITILSLTLFVIDYDKAERRISGTFTLILTSFSFKIVTSKTLPTISYLTSLDKYQIINIVYLGICCVWHSVCTSLNVSGFNFRTKTNARHTYVHYKTCVKKRKKKLNKVL